jgi:signal transduction histidine kinase
MWSGVHSIAAVQSQSSVPSGQIQQPTPPGEPPPFGQPIDPRDPMQRQRLERMEKARQTERQQQLVRDTDKLLNLAKQLKEQVDKSNKDMLSIDVVKKAAEIEKLAKSVKDRMRG